MADFNNKSADRESTNVKSGADDEVRTDTEELHDDQVSIEDIVDFYKNIPLTEDDSEPEKKTDDKPKKKLFSSRKKKITAEQTKDEGIHDSSYGLNVRGRSAAAYAITAIICVLIIGASYILAVFMPGDEEIISKAADELRTEEEYKETENEHNSLSYEINKLKTAVEAKESNINSVSDFDNAKAAIRSEIEKKKAELASLNEQLSLKQERLNVLNWQISQKAGSAVSLSPGKYTVGKNIVPGKYLVTGSGKLMTASSSGESKVNITLGADACEVTLEKDDIIKLETTAKFTPAH